MSLLIVLMLCVICTVSITMAAVEETVTTTAEATKQLTILPTAPPTTIPTAIPTMVPATPLPSESTTVLNETASVMPVSADAAVSTYTQTALKIQAGGASVYMGEQGLDLTGTLTAARAVAVPATTSTQIGWWASAAVITTTAPTNSIDLAGQYVNYQINPATFVGYTGYWYLLTTNGQAAVDYSGRPVVVFNVKDPSLAIKVWNYDNSADVSDGSVTQGKHLGFQIDTNMYSALDARYRAPVYNRPGVNADNAGDGYMMIRVKDVSGTTLTSLYSSDGILKTLTYLNVSTQPYKWGTEFGNNYNWDTGSKVSASNQYVYPTGTYTVYAESWLNNIEENYKNGGSYYTGKTISETRTVTILEAPPEPEPVNSTYTQTALKIQAGGASVYMGEQGLDLTGTLTAARAVAVPATTNTQIGWWASAAVITTTAPTNSIDLAGQYVNYQINPATFVGYTGYWYLLTTNGQAAVDYSGRPVVVFNVKDPSLAIKVWNYDNSADVSDGSVTQGKHLGFQIDTNMYSALDARYRAPVYNRPGVNADNAGDGYMMIRVKDVSGTTLTSLYSSDGILKTLTYLNVSTQPYKWGTEFGNNYNWDTGSKVSASNQYVYPTGTYTVYAESWLNNMKENYKNGGSYYTGKTISETRTVTILEAPPEPEPVAAFTGTPTTGTAPLTVTFTDSSTNTPTSWLWNFGDSSSVNATVKNPVHTYTSASTYTVSLTATNAAGSNTKTVANYITVTAPSSVDNVGVFRGGVFYRNGADAIVYGLSTDTPVVGDWNGDGMSEVGVFRGGVFYRNGADAIVYGLSTDTPVVGDWNGDGMSEVGVFRGGVFYRNGADAIVYGLPTDTPVIGDWNGDGMSEVGVFRGGVFYRNGADAIVYGLPTDTPVIGDWNGDGMSEVGVFRGGVFYRNGADAIVYGLPTDTPVIGDWNGDGMSEVGVFRGGVFYRNGADAIVYGLSTDTPVIGKWT